MKTFCAKCGKKVPKRRTEGDKSSYGRFFCGTACHVAYADDMIGLFRNAEVEAEKELQQEVAEGQPWTRQVLDDIDQAAAEATMEGQRPQEIAARFLGKVGAKVATQLYTKLEEGVRSWAQNRTRAPDDEDEPERPAANEPGKKKPAKKEGERQQKSQEKPQQKAQKNGAHKNGKPSSPPPSSPPPTTPPPSKPSPSNPTGEPPDLDDRPLDEQRMWLLRRFIHLGPNPTFDDVTKEWRKLATKYHPDNAKTGNPRMMTLVNSTYQRLKEIREEIGWPGED